MSSHPPVTSPIPPLGLAERPLALLGGTPLFAEPLHVGRPNIGDEAQFMLRLRSMFDRRWFSNDGPLVREFEQAICSLTGVRNCVAMCNATVALEIAARAVGFAGEVIVPAYTFVATAHCLQWQEITPVFCDIDPRTHNLDPAALERLITPRTTGIIGVHVWGRPCDTEAIEAIAKKHGLRVIYDAAHALGCSHNGQMIGNFGECEVFSFHATKFINTFEGGAVVTNNDELAARLRLMRNFGFAGFDRVTYLGTNGKMTEVCAAMGLTSLSSIESLVAINKENWQSYRSALADVPGIKMIDFKAGERHNYQYAVAEIDPDVSPLGRDEIVAVLHAENILARKYFWPGVHKLEPYRSLQPNASLMLAKTDALAARVIVLPTGQTIDADTIARITSVIKTSIRCVDEVRAALAAKH